MNFRKTDGKKYQWPNEYHDCQPIARTSIACTSIACTSVIMRSLERIVVQHWGGSETHSGLRTNKAVAQRGSPAARLI